jgi:hypothetical protein
MHPAFAIQNARWDNLQRFPAYAGLSPDDNVTSWMVTLPIIVRPGNFTGNFIGTIMAAYGQNAGPFYGGYASPFHNMYRDPAGRIKDTTDICGLIGLAYIIGPATPAIYFGYDRAMNSDEWKVGNNYNARVLYGASVHIKIQRQKPSVWPFYDFAIVPEIDFYDYGQFPGVAGSPNIGKEVIWGVQFQFVF